MDREEGAIVRFLWPAEVGRRRDCCSRRDDRYTDSMKSFL